jgi:hypothetical protein
MTVEEQVSWDARHMRDLSLGSDLKITIRTIGYLRRPPPVY